MNRDEPKRGEFRLRGYSIWALDIVYRGGAPRTEVTPTLRTAEERETTTNGSTGVSRRSLHGESGKDAEVKAA